jgi:hypothetical protein
MSLEYEKKLEDRIHQELLKVSERPAPASLAASVLAAIKAREARPWWRRPIPEWPRRNQFVFVSLAFCCVLAAVAGLFQIWPHEAIQNIPTQAAEVIDPVRPVFSIGETLARAGALLVQSISQPWLIGIGAALVLGYLSCVAMGMAWYRITFQKGLVQA